MKIIIDAFGGDNAPGAIVQGALEARRLHGVDILLVGRAEEVLRAVRRAFSVLEEEGETPLVMEDGVPEQIASACGGDVRKAMNAVELSVLSAEVTAEGTRRVLLENARELTQKSAVRYDKEGDEHYDLISAFQKSMRGSDPDAAVYYLARLLAAGDLPSVCRRLMVCACEDVGLAYPQIIPIVKAAVDAALQIGLPEARLPLADAVILVAISPKSNSAHDAIARASADVEAGKIGRIPRQLQNKHYDGEDNPNKGQFYRYPHITRITGWSSSICRISSRVHAITSGETTKRSRASAVI